jgi:hypothetical protein
MESHLNAYEVWTLDSFTISKSKAVVQFVGQPEKRSIAPVPADGLPFDARNEVEQFNANVQMLWSRVSRLVPESYELLDWLSEDMARAVQLLHDLQSWKAPTTGTLIAIPRPKPQDYDGTLSLLVETNACLTLLISQLTAGNPNLLETFYCVGKYSLLGVGGALRGLTRLYTHINGQFAKWRIVSQLRRMKAGAAFDAKQTPFQLQIDADSLANSPVKLSDEPQTVVPVRHHIVYLSTRHGFHETTQTISVSWQCLQACSAKEWNLLTFSHEYLHSHVSEVLDELLYPRDHISLQELADRFNEDSGTLTWWHSSTRLLVNALRWIDAIPELVDGKPGDEFPDRVTTDQVLSLINRHGRFLEEIIVHVLDFVYFYDSDSDLYVESLWRSWSFVPFVRLNVEAYVLRSLLALAATYDVRIGPDSAFDRAVAMLQASLAKIATDRAPGRDLAPEALAMLSESSTKSRKAPLRTQFFGLFQLAWWTGRFLQLNRLHLDLVNDDSADQVDGRLAYDTEPGRYLVEEAASPVSLLLDTFRRLSLDGEDQELESTSLWQLLQFT